MNDMQSETALDKKGLTLQTLSANMKKVFLLVALQGVFYLSVAQNVNKVFRNLKWNEQFKSIQGVWSQTSTAQNIFLQDEEGYNVWRKNKSNGFVLLPDNDFSFNFFEAELSFSFDKGEGKGQYAGLVLQAQEGGTGALIVEVNRKRQYRIRRASGSRIMNISEGKEGWVKDNKIKGRTDFVLKIVTKDRLYDIYINGVFIQTFTEVDFTEGQIGLYIGESSRAIFSSLKVKSDDDEPDFFTKGTNKTQAEILTETIIKLRENINKKDQQIASMEADRRNSSQSTSNDSATLAELSTLRSENRSLEGKIEDLEAASETMQAQIKRLQRFKNEIAENESGDIVINLSNLTTTQKQKIDEHQNTIRLQTEAIENLKIDNYTNSKTISVLELKALRSDELLFQYEQDVKTMDSIKIELEYQIRSLEKKNAKLEKNQNADSNKKERKKKRKKIKEEDLPEFIIEE